MVSSTGGAGKTGLSQEEGAGPPPFTIHIQRLTQNGSTA